MARNTKKKNAPKSAKCGNAEKRKTQPKTTKASRGKGATPTLAVARSNNVVKESSSPSKSTTRANGQSQQAAPKNGAKAEQSVVHTQQRSQTSKSTTRANGQSQQAAPKNGAKAEQSVVHTQQRSQTSKSTPGVNGQSQQAAPKKPARCKNVSQTIPNGTLLITYDIYFYGTDGESDKKRMAVIVDSNRDDELAIVKYTTSKKHGRPFDNSKGFVGHGDKIYTLDNDKKPIKADGKKFIAQGKREITTAQANEIKRRNVKESKYKAGNRKNLQNLKKRKK